MTLTVKKMVKQNNEKRNLLTPENKTYYENMLLYIRTNAFKGEKATEEVLLEMLDHLLEAQKEGKRAEEVFGKAPQQLAQDIIESLPNESVKKVIGFSLEIILTLFGWYLVAWGAPDLILKEGSTIYLGTASVSIVLIVGSLVGLIYFIFAVLKKSAFTNKKKKNKVTWGLGIIFGLVWAGVILLNIFVKPFGPAIHINYYTAFGLGCFLLLASYLFKKSREAK